MRKMDINEVAEQLRLEALKKLEYLAASSNHRYADPMDYGLIYRRIAVGEIFFQDYSNTSIYKLLGWQAVLDRKAEHSLRVLQHEQITNGSSTETIPSDPLSHLLLWMGDRCRYERIRAWLRSKAKTRTIHLKTTRTVKLFLPPWPIKQTDKNYLEWVAWEQRSTK
jgi:hypothetical protein